jgi:hypothetical protein
VNGEAPCAGRRGTRRRQRQRDESDWNRIPHGSYIT